MKREREGACDEESGRKRGRREGEGQEERVRVGFTFHCFVGLICNRTQIDDIMSLLSRFNSSFLDKSKGFTENIINDHQKFKTSNDETITRIEQKRMVCENETFDEVGHSACERRFTFVLVSF